MGSILTNGVTDQQSEVSLPAAGCDTWLEQFEWPGPWRPGGLPSDIIGRAEVQGLTISLLDQLFPKD